MPAAVVPIGPAFREEAFSRCRDVLRAGGIIAYPTDTFYGLGVDPRNPAAIRRLFAVKGRSPEQPILLLIHDAAEVVRWAVSTGKTAEQLMHLHWPGPLTLVFQARPDVSPELTAGKGTIGLRVPGSEMARSLLRTFGAALTGTSANRSGEAEARTAADVMRMFEDSLDLVLDGGPSIADKPSTIVDVSGPLPTLIRRGAVEVNLE